MFHERIILASRNDLYTLAVNWMEFLFRFSFAFSALLLPCSDDCQIYGCGIILGSFGDWSLQSTINSRFSSRQQMYQRSKANINDHIMDFYPLIILSFFRERVGKVPGYTCINLISLGPTRASWTAHTRGGMLLTKELSLSGLKAYQATITASRNCCCVVGGLSISRIWIAIWSQICSIRFISGLLADQSMTYTVWFSRKIIVARVMCAEALSWNSTKFLRKVFLAQGKTFCLSTRRQTCWFMGPSTITSSLLPPKWTAIDAADRNSTSNPTIELYSWPDQTPVPLSIFRSNSKFDENSECSSF